MVQVDPAEGRQNHGGSGHLRPKGKSDAGRPRAKENQDSQACVVLEMVGDEGKPHWIDVQEAERRKEDASEDEGRHQGTPADALLQGEKNEDEEPRRCRKSIMPRRRVIDFPAGIDED